MAVYTKLNKVNIEEILSNYSIGKLKDFKGIEDGIENTNYFLLTNNGKFILTIYEKRVQEKDLPFFSELMLGLNKADFKCPVPIINNQNKAITKYKNKSLMIVSFLEGKAKSVLNPEDCKALGNEVAKMHLITKNFKIKRENDLSIGSWRKIFDQVKDQCIKIHKDLPKLIEANLKDVEKNWPKNLPNGIIHADLFSDNIFFKDNKFSGIIDFYFSCNDFYALEIAICFNALCFDGPKNNLSFNVTKAKNFMDGYNQLRKLNDEEKRSIKTLSQGSALRFLLTRVFDALNVVEGAIVKVKDPIEYLVRLEFHKNSKNVEDYFFQMKYTIYTDGACSGNPGPGGWGAVIIDEKNKQINISGKENLTTNNRMELTAPIRALSKIKKYSKIIIFTDSTYLKNGVTLWIKNWEKNGWKSANKKPVKNKDLWLELNKITKQRDITWKWVKAHAGNIHNEQADKLATEAINN